MKFETISGKYALIFDEVPAFVFVSDGEEAKAFEKGVQVTDVDRVLIDASLSIGTRRPFPRVGSTLIHSPQRKDAADLRSLFRAVDNVSSKVFEIIK
ncbi:hypothetical protein [Paenibacillus sp. B-A-8]|uniref:hypothetical protein n=1 Tax=Paenibacillus sp. B-A-8 TaxID=3400419 RepID=UPI003B029C60